MGAVVFLHFRESASLKFPAQPLSVYSGTSSSPHVSTHKSRRAVPGY